MPQSGGVRHSRIDAVPLAPARSAARRQPSGLRWFADENGIGVGVRRVAGPCRAGAGRCRFPRRRPALGMWQAVQPIDLNVASPAFTCAASLSSAGLIATGARQAPHVFDQGVAFAFVHVQPRRGEAGQAGVGRLVAAGDLEPDLAGGGRADELVRASPFAPSSRSGRYARLSGGSPAP